MDFFEGQQPFLASIDTLLTHGITLHFEDAHTYGMHQLFKGHALNQSSII